MEKAYECAKSAIVNFKLDTCCCCAPLRIGVLVTGYVNVFIALLSLIETASSDSGIAPPLMAVQNIFLEDQKSQAFGILAYASELSFNVVLLSAMYRNDIVLLRVYIYAIVATIVISVLVYSMVIAVVSFLTKMVIIVNLVYNVYIIILVRSAIVEIRENQISEKNGHVVLYSVAQIPHDDKKVPDVEAPTEPSEETVHKVEIKEESKEENKEEEPKAKLEMVVENPKAE